MKPGLVIGNGESRLALPVRDVVISGLFDVAACNKAAGDFLDAQHFVCVDDRMRKWLSARFPKDPRILYRPYKPSGYASGPSALGLLAARGCPLVVLAGFDGCWTPHGERRLNNVYKDTDGYAGSNTAHCNNIAQMEQVADILAAFPDLRVVQAGVESMTPRTIPKSVNLKGGRMERLARIGFFDGAELAQWEALACVPSS